jgi:hypothetical protein
MFNITYDNSVLNKEEKEKLITNYIMNIDENIGKNELYELGLCDDDIEELKDPDYINCYDDDDKPGNYLVKVMVLI